MAEPDHRHTSEVSVLLPPEGSELVIQSEKRQEYIILSNRSRKISCQVMPNVAIYVGPGIIPADDTEFVDDEGYLSMVEDASHDEQIHLMLFNRVRQCCESQTTEEFFLYMRD
jgi:hypothetical protein